MQSSSHPISVLDEPLNHPLAIQLSVIVYLPNGLLLTGKKLMMEIN